MKKRLLSAFMALALCLTLLPTAALAAETEGTVQTPPAVEKAADPANGEEQQENQPAAPKQENQSAEQEEQQEDSAAKQAVAAVQALIDALPAVDELDGMDDDDAMAVYEAFQAACDAYYDTLTEEQQAQLKNTEKLAALSDWFNAQVAPLENSGDIYPDTVDADGGITAGTSFSRNGPIVEDSEDSTTFYDNQYYVVKESSNVTINGDLIIDSCINNGLILCKGATLTVTGALIHKGGTFPIYGVSDSGQNAGRLVIKNSSGSGAAIRATGNNAQLGISSGELELHDGGSGKLVDGVNLSSTNHIHQGTLDGTALSPAEWGVTSLKGGTLTLAYCTHDNATYVSANQTQHTKHCPDCGFVGTAVACGNNGSEGSVSVGDGGHRQKCPCGNTFGDVIPHTVETVPTHSKEHHVSGCQYCDYTSGSPETHEWDSTTGECTKCHFKPIAQGTWLSIHDSLQEAMDEASEITGAKALVTLYSEASGNTAIDDEFEFNYPGKTITLDMAGYSLEHQGNPIITVEAGTLIVKGTATITKKADSPEQVNSAIVVKGGELIFEGAVTATGGKYSNKVASAIEVSGGKLTFNDEVNAKAESIDTAQPSGYTLAPAINVTGGEVTFAQKLTATGGIFKDGTNLSKQEPAVYATSGTLDFKGDLDLNGGLTLTKSAKLANLLTQGTFSVSAGTGSSPLSVKASSVYKKVSDLLAEGYACVKTDSLAEGKEKEYANTRAYTCSDNVTIVKHEHEWKLDSQYPHLHSCACGKSENHEYDSSTGKCKICQSECSHKAVDNDGTCFTCKAQMLVKIENGGNTTYGTDFKAAMNAAVDGTKITLLADVSILGRTGISSDGTTVTLDLNGHKITSGWLDVGGKDTNGTYTACTLKIIGKGSYEPPMYGGIITVDMKATLDLSEWEGGTISSINISDSSDYEAATREAAVIVGSKAGTIGNLSFGNNQLPKITKTKLSGGSFNEIWVADFGPVKLGELLADGYAYQNANGSYVEYGTKLQGASIFNVKVVKCPHAKINEDDHCAYCNATGFVAQVTAADGSSSAYTDIAAAIAAADGGTVKLLANAGEITISSPLKLDLNGKTAAKLTVTGDVTLASLLPEGCAFKSGSTWISDLSGTELTNVSMAKIPIKSMNYPTEMSMTYGGAGTLLVTVAKETGTGAVNFQWYKVEDGNETAVGSATAKNQFDLSALKLPAGQHTFRFSATCDGYKKMSQDIAVTVQRVDIRPSLITPPTAQENLTYTGQKQALIIAGSVDAQYGEMQYRLGTSGNFSTAIPTGTDAGTYTVWYRVIGDANHNDTVPASVVVRIGQKPLPLTGVTAASKPYDGTTNADISSVTFDNVTLNRGTDYTVAASFDDASVGNGKNVTATVTLMGQAAKNYALEQSSFTTTGNITKAAAPDFTKETTLVIVNGHEKTYTVTLPALPALEAPREYGAVTYGAPTVSLSSGYYTDGAKVENGELTLPIQKNDVETTGSVGTVTVVIKSANYEDITLTVIIFAKNKLTPVMDGKITASKITYGQALSDSSITGKMKDPNTGDEVKGTFTWQNPDTVLDASDLGSDAEWKFTPTDKAAYTEATGIAMVKVDKAMQYGKVSMAGYTYGQAPSTPTLTNRTGDANAQVTYRYSAAGSGSVQTWDIQNPPALNAGTYRMFARIGQTSNYYEYDVGYCEFVVAKATPTYTKPTGLTAKYGQTLEDVTLPDGWSWMDSSESVGGASTAAKTFQAKFAPTDAVNYNMVENIGLEVMVNKADQAALTIQGADSVFYGQTLTLTTSGGSGSGAVTYTATNGTGEATIDAATGKLTPVKVGTVKVTATKAGDASYNSITSAEVEITITRATPTGEPAYTKITASGKTLADAALGIGTITPAGGTIAWDDPTTTEVVANKSYGWTYTPTDTNYTTRTGTIKLWSKSSGGGSGRTAAVVAPDMPMLYRGCTGDAVKTLQEKLNATGFDSGNVDGIFGAKTYAAVTAFQKANGLGVDGIVGKLTWGKLYGVSPAMPVETTTVVGRPMVSYGSRGDAVRKLQELLNALGYDCGSVDGIFGSKTKAAVLAFQKANGLGADGIVGPLTWGKLV